MTSHHRTQILIVDDDPMDRMLIRRSLQELDLGCTISDLSDGQAALDHLLADDADPGSYLLVLLDLKMPRVSGITVLEKLSAKQVHRKVPIVVMSSSALEEDIVNAYKFGARAYITKPIQYDDFRRVVQAAGQFWINYNQLPEAPHVSGHEVGL